MTKRFKMFVVSLAAATVCTLGATRQASAFDLLEELLGVSAYSDSCGCSQKGGGHVQHGDSKCGSKGSGGHVQHGGGKGKGCGGGHVQHGGGKGKGCGGGHVQQGGGKGNGCGGHVQQGGSKGKSCGGGHVQQGGSKGKSSGGHVQHSGRKGGSGKSAKKHVDLLSKMQAKMAHIKCKLSKPSCDCCYDDGKGYAVDYKSGVFGDSKPLAAPAPIIGEPIQGVPVPPDPDPAT